MSDTFLNGTGLGYYHNRIKTIFASKADLDTLEDRVDDIVAEGGEPNVIETVKVNGTALMPVSKAVDVEVPTTVAELADATDYALAASVPTKVSDLANDSGYQDASDVQDAIDAALEDITGIDFQVVQSLPATGEHGVIYLVAQQGGNGYDEYIWLTPAGGSSHFEQIGSTDIDLSGYWAKSELAAITTAQIDALFA